MDVDFAEPVSWSMAVSFVPRTYTGVPIRICQWSTEWARLLSYLSC